MRKLLAVLISLLLTACVDDSASYYVDKDSSNHALTVRRVQEQLWSDDVLVTLTLTRLPECQRRITLALMPADEVELELFANGDNIWTLRAGTLLWQVDTETCTEFEEAKGELGEALGSFKIENNKLVFEPVAAPKGAAKDRAAPAPQ